MKHIRTAVMAIFMGISLTNTVFAQDIFCETYLRKPFDLRIEAFRDFKPPDEDPYSVLMDKSIRLNYILEEPKEMYVTTKNGLLIRSDSSADSERVGSLEFAKSIIVDGISVDGKWYHTDRGYISEEYVSVEKPKAEISVLSGCYEQDNGFAENNQKSFTQSEINATEYLGVFKLTFYCNCSICAGEWAGGRTEYGTYPVSGWTIAVDKSVIPLGSHVIINGHEYRAEDTGGGVTGNKIDVYMDSHSAALEAGVQYADVYLKK